MRRCLLLYGLTCILGQVLSLRELTVAFHGNELVYGAALAAWLLLVALGSGPLGRFAARRRPGVPAFALSLAASGALVPLTILLIRMARWYVVGRTGVAASFGHMLAVTLLALAPLCITLGLFYALACSVAMRVAAPDEPPASVATRVYVFESLGIFLGGMAFMFVLASLLDALLIGCTVAAVNCLAAIALWWHGDRRATPWGWAFLPLFAGFVAMLATPAGRIVDFVSQTSRFPGRTLRASFDTPYGRVDVAENKGQTEFYQNGVLSGATHMDAATEEAVLPGLLAHPRPRRVLLIGGSVTGALDKILSLSDVEVECVELDPAIIAAARRYMRTANARSLRSDRAHLITNTDARRFIKARRNRYDVIISMAPNPSSGLINRFYTREFFLEARRALRPGGVLALRLDGAPDYMSAPHRTLAATVYRTLGAAFGAVAALPSGHAIHFLATATAEPHSLHGALLVQRLNARRLEPKWLTANELMEMTQPLAVTRLLSTLKTTDVRSLNTDLHPLAYTHALRLWADAFQMRAKGLLDRALRLNLPQVMLGIVGATFLLALALAVTRRRLTLGVAAVRVYSGAAGFMLELVLLFAFQSFFGTTYGWISILFAAFMVGATLGAAAANRFQASPREVRVLMALQIALGLLAAALIPACRALGAGGHSAAPIAIPLLNLLAGALVGAQYPVSVSACTRVVADASNRARIAARLYALDLAGACAGALIGGAILIPVLGIANTAWAVAGLCMASLPVLLLAETESPTP